jgi:hypothetical protein
MHRLKLNHAREPFSPFGGIVKISKSALWRPQPDHQPSDALGQRLDIVARKGAENISQVARAAHQKKLPASQAWQSAPEVRGCERSRDHSHPLKRLPEMVAVFPNREAVASPLFREIYWRFALSPISTRPARLEITMAAGSGPTTSCGNKCPDDVANQNASEKNACQQVWCRQLHGDEHLSGNGPTS